MIASIEFATGLLGLFLAFPLLAMMRNRPANGWLGLFILSVSLLSLAFPIYARLPQLFGLFDWPLAAVGAFFYCYVRSLTGLGNARQQQWHFLPLALLVGALAYGRAFHSGPDLLGLLFGGSLPLFGMLLLGFQLLAGCYAVAALYRLGQYRTRLRERYSSVERRDLQWLSWLSVCFIALLILWIPSNLIGGVWTLLLILGRLLVLYFVGWFGLRQGAVFMTPIAAGKADGIDQAARPAVIEVKTPADEFSCADIDPVVEQKYARSGMTEAAGQLIGERMRRWEEHERGYLDSDIKLVDLAECIGTSPQLLSQYLNDILATSFFDYINGLRVAEVQRLMRDRANDGRTLLDLAFAAGFNSKSTFNNSFKKINGLAPSSWRRLQRGTSVPIGQGVAASVSEHT
ncbi:helix-turn-helix domain-containing protein [Pseudoduganella chitinolytica]|uniref:AraC family transcriptional regulator n=1 Tax=Pseudoduganella chitinolytica TaxID=34070 RepID=A0ABY8BE14_9BURK|nr:AraC family transcriptional regulator [Pseudoduganella chitinolytica]WEF34075.1 AraC family transcriptional regulator [Pseudoduganella chitinolytica]